MPVSFNSPPRNFFLLGSGSEQGVTNFFHNINRSSLTDGQYSVSDTGYTVSDQKFLLAGSGKDSNTVSFGFIEKQAYDAETDPANPTNVEAWRTKVNSSISGNNCTLNFMRQTGEYGGDIIAGGKSNGVPWISKFDLNGVEVWSSTSQTADVEYFDVAVKSDKIYACGYKNLIGSDQVAFVEKWDSDGNPLWGKSATRIGGDVRLRAIAANDRDQVVAVGAIDGVEWQGYVVKLDANTGEIIWDLTINSGEEYQSGSKNPIELRDVYIDAKDQIYIVGSESIYTTGVFNNGIIFKYSAEGNLIWQRRTALGEEQCYYKVWSDTAVEQTVVISHEVVAGSPTKRGPSLIKYSKNGDIVFKRRIQSSTNFSDEPYGLEGDPSFYYILFVDEQENVGTGASKTYNFGKVSSSGNGFGEFTYDATNSKTITYSVNSAADRIGRLSDGSVRNDTSDQISYPYNGLKTLFDDYAINIAYKKTRHEDKDVFSYGGSPSIRTVSPDLLSYANETYDITTAGGGTPVGQAEFTTVGTYSWTAPAGVTSVSVVCVGAGGTGGAYGGGGGSLVYKNDITTVPGTAYTVEVGGTNTEEDANGQLVNKWAGNSSVLGTEAYGGAGGYVAQGQRQGDGYGLNYDGGGKGGFRSTDFYQSGVGYKGGCGGGAGGYSGDGGGAGGGLGAGGNASGGGGGGGATGSSGNSFGGGGVGIYGEGSSGSGGTPVHNGGNGFGGGGSGGGNGTERQSGSNAEAGGGLYGGGGGGNNDSSPLVTSNRGAVRLIWGPGREFPSTLTADQTPSGGSVTTTYIKDLTGNGNDATISGPTLNADGHWDFAGGTTGTQVIDTGVNAGSVTNLTIECWIKVDTYTNSGSGITIGDTGATRSSYLGVGTSGGNSIDWRFYLDPYQQECEYFTDSNDWQHCVGTYDQDAGYGTMRLYVNGVLRDTAINTGNTSAIDFSSGRNILLGTNTYNSAEGDLDGKIGEVHISKKTLTAGEVFQNYNATKIKYINEAPDTTAKVVTGVVVDSSIQLNYDFGHKTTLNRATNLIPYSYMVENSWDEGSGGTLTMNAGFAPDGSYTAAKALSSSNDIDLNPKLTWDGVGNGAVTIEPNGTYTFSVWLKASTPEQVGNSFKVRMKRVSGTLFNPENTITLTADWKRYSVSGTVNADNTQLMCYVGGFVGCEALVWGAQLEGGISLNSPVLESYVQTYGTGITYKDGDDFITNKLYDMGGNEKVTGTPAKLIASYDVVNRITEKEKGVYFDGKESRIFIPVVTDGGGNLLQGATGFSGQAFTLEAWVYALSFTSIDGDTDQVIVGLGTTGLNGQLAFQNGQLRGRGGTGVFNEWALDPATCSVQQWYHVVCTYGSQRYVNLYKNGSEVATYDAGAGLAPSISDNQTVGIGTYDNADNSFAYAGWMGQVRIYNRTLTAAEVLNNYNATRGKYGV